MGIPRFYRSLVHRYPLARRSFSDPSRPMFHDFYIDFTSLIYLCNSVISPKFPDDYQPLISEVLRYLDILVHLVQPQCLIYIAAEGTPPFSKTIRQRARRLFLGQKGRLKVFDSAQIVPGSAFIDKLHHCLLSFLDEKKEKDEAWKQAQVIYSSYHTPGEGEQKIISWIQERGKENRICIFTPDTDMILLALRARKKYCCIMRSKNLWRTGHELRVGNAKLPKLETSESGFELLYLNVLMEYLLVDFPLEDRSFDVAWNVCDDFIAISAILGNDFLPPLSDIGTRVMEFEKLINVYRNAVFLKNDRIVSDGQLQIRPFHNFIAKLASMKKTCVAAKGEFDQRVCGEYLTGLSWVLGYYWGKDVNPEWRFEAKVVPSIDEIAEYCQDRTVDVHWSRCGKGRQLTPFELMMCVLTVRHQEGVPQELRESMMDVCNNGCTEFKVVTYSQKDEWEMADVPIIDLDLVRRTVEEALIRMPDDVKERNNNLPEPITLGKVVSVSIDGYYFPSMSYCVPAHVKINCTSLDRESTINKTRTTAIFTNISTKGDVDLPEFRVEDTILVGWPFWKRAQVESFRATMPLALRNKYSEKWAIKLPEDCPCVVCRMLTPANSDRTLWIWSRKETIVPTVLCQCNSSRIKHFVRSEFHLPKHFGVVIDGDNAGVTVDITNSDKTSAAVTIAHSSWPVTGEDIKELKNSSKWMTIPEISERYGLHVDQMTYLLKSWPLKNDQDIAFTLFGTKHGEESADDQCDYVLDGFSKVSIRTHQLMVHEDVLPELDEYFERAGQLKDVLVSGGDVSSAIPEPRALIAWITNESILSRQTLIESRHKKFSQSQITRLAQMAAMPCPPDLTTKPSVIPKRLLFSLDSFTVEQKAELGSRAIVISAFAPLAFGSRVIVVGGNREERTIDVVLCSPIEYVYQDLPFDRRIWTLKKGDVFLFKQE